ncbi:hypothetical protein HOLleu_41820 [Holothuria leucospilota]|uniref:Uncharacterized protein n=1 Tax=Holothuria leucospilota TaxID=206669 RepID=A0A9Q0YC00_HOLLE|nr:hypothetical protein HOLleu_41820 [Holothuria leucospilota]
MTTNCWRPEDMRWFLLVFTMTVSATGESATPILPPTTSEEPTITLHERSAILTSASVVVFCLVTMIIMIMSLLQKRRIRKKRPNVKRTRYRNSMDRSELGLRRGREDTSLPLNRAC